MPNNNGQVHFYELAYDDWFVDLYDDWYPELSDEVKGPFRPICAMMETFDELKNKEKRQVKILDCACGTGNNYIFFTRAGYDIWGTDGSEKMLDRAVENCAKNKIADNQLIRRPIQWSNWTAYANNFDVGSFDFILINSNSLCHIPSTPRYVKAAPSTQMYMQDALKIFHKLLKPGGRLLIDTKRYREAAPVEGVPIFQELRYVEPVWIIRSLREDGPRNIEGMEGIYVHTRMHYDVDPCFKVCRAFIIVTMYGKSKDIAPPLLPPTG
jgi:SAM-dependent methyltransferase